MCGYVQKAKIVSDCNRFYRSLTHLKGYPTRYTLCFTCKRNDKSNQKSLFQWILSWGYVQTTKIEQHCKRHCFTDRFNRSLTREKAFELVICYALLASSTHQTRVNKDGQFFLVLMQETAILIILLVTTDTIIKTNLKVL